MLLMSCALAQNPATGTATLQDVHIARDGNTLRAEVILSSPVKASVATASHADRLVLQLPNTRSTMKQQSMAVNTNGVRRVRISLHSVNPLITQVVLDLDRAHPYSLASDANRIILTVGPAVSMQAGASQGAPAAAASGGLLGVFHRRTDAQPQLSSNTSATLVSPPASGSQTVAEAASVTLPTASGPTAAGPPQTQSASFPQSYPTSSTGSAGLLAVGQGQPTPTSQSANGNGPAEPVPAAASGEPSTAKEANGVSGAEPALAVRAADPNLRTVFKVKYVAEGVAYLEGGRSAGLAEGMKLEIKDTDFPAQQGAAVDPSDPRVIAELEITALAETSAVTDIHSPKRPVKVGDLAYLSSADTEALVQQRALSATRKYPAVVTFTEGDTLDEEVRDEVPRPPLPSVNRARGQIGFDYMGTISHGSSAMTSSDFGMILRTDISRINGTYWNLSGYWRGRFNSQSAASQQTLQDLINRTYHLSMTYDNPNSAWVAGFGRLYLPWANSLDTIDGGYFGRRLSKGTTTGIFGGSTPDPTSWDYSPDRVIGGGFINFEGGSFDAVHYSSTLGAGISMVNWQLDRPFGFVENMVSYKRYLSIYDSMQVDSPQGNPAVPAPSAGLSRSFFTARIQVHPRVELDFNHNYFRDIPTFDPRLIGTGLLDKYLFQGFSVGTRVEVKKQIFVYTDLGRSNRSGDAKSSWNQMYGVTFGHLPWFSLRANAHYSRFNSSFGSGSYKSFSLSRNLGDDSRLEVLLGDQTFASQFSNNTRSRFITANAETSLGSRFFVQGGYTINRGQFSYDQWMFTLGYRFDSKARHRE